jgi:anti-anti-sigma factor
MEVRSRSSAHLAAHPLAFEVRVTHGPGWDRVTLEGELDLAAAPLLEDELGRLERQPAALLVMDLRQLSFMDLIGMRVLLAARDRALLGARSLAFVRGPRIVHRLFELAGVGHELDVIVDATEAQLPAGSSEADALLDGGRRWRRL